MQRSLGDEVLIAIIAVAVIAFATAFGVILSLVTAEPIEPTAVAALATLPPTATINFTPFATFTREASATSEATPTPSASPTETASQTPTLTATVSASATETLTAISIVTETPSYTPTSSPTDIPSNTPTPEPSNTATPEPSATVTPTARLTATASPSPQPTATLTLTATLTMTYTPTFTATATPTVTATPSVTHTPTATRTNTHTATPIPSRTTIPTITLIPSITPTSTATSFPIDCELPERWMRLTIKPDDTLESLAAAAGVPVERVIRRNCLSGDVKLIAGDAILLPATAQVSSAPIDALMGCRTPAVAFIAGVEVGAILRGLVEVEGTVGGEDFRRYRLEIRPDGYMRYLPILAGNTPVNGRVLGLFDTAGLPSGLAWLRVVVTTDAGTDDVCVIPVVIR